MLTLNPLEVALGCNRATGDLLPGEMFWTIPWLLGLVADDGNMDIHSFIFWINPYRKPEIFLLWNGLSKNFQYFNDLRSRVWIPLNCFELFHSISVLCRMVIFLKKNLLKYSLTKFHVQMKNLVLEIQIHVQTKYYTG